MKTVLSLTFFLIFGFVQTGCTDDPSGEQNTSTAQRQQVSYEAIGRVVSIPDSRKFVQIDHETIPGFMEAMTMVFPVKDTLLLNGISAEDSVSFKLETSEIGQLFIVEMTGY